MVRDGHIKKGRGKKDREKTLRAGDGSTIFSTSLTLFVAQSVIHFSDGQNPESLKTKRNEYSIIFNWFICMRLTDK